jgi:glycosyltransferase involved in cell wall biosynthesis
MSKDILKQLSHMKRNLGDLSVKPKEPKERKDPKDKKERKDTKDTKSHKKSKSPKEKKSHKEKKSGNSMKIVLNTIYAQIKSTPQKYPKESKWIAPQGATGVKYVCYLGSTGYADAAKGYIRSLVESGVYVHIDPLRYCDEKSSDTITNDDLVLATCLNNSHIKCDTVIIHSIPNEWKSVVKAERKRNPSVRIYGLTVWETDRVDPTWMDLIMDCNLTGLIVPSQWNCQTFINTAHSLKLDKFPPVYTCHHAITDYTKQKRCQILDRTAIYGPNVRLALLCIGTWTHRKGVEESVRAYLSAFKGKQDVVLYLKTSDGAYTVANSDRLKTRLKTICDQYQNTPRIILDTTLRPDDFIDNLVTHCDVYLSLCNSEGVGLGACQAALKGKIIVMTGFGGQTEYVKEGCWINYKLNAVNVPTNFVEWIKPPQRWGYPSIDHAIKKLHDIYANKDTYCEKSKQNRVHLLNNFSYVAQGNKLKIIFASKNKV